MKTRILFLFISLGIITACAPKPQQLQTMLEEHPEILINAIQKNPLPVMLALQEANEAARMQLAEEEEKAELAAREEEFSNPKQPEIRPGRAIRGNKFAPVTIVVYSDFQCPYCERGYRNLQTIHERYGDKLRIVYKHMPLSFHPLAMPAARYFEALARQSAEMAYSFHDALYENQDLLKNEEGAFLQEAAQKTGADMAQLDKDLQDETLKAIILSDINEAKNFGFDGTPAFLINGVSLEGAQPVEEFLKVIERHLQEL